MGRRRSVLLVEPYFSGSHRQWAEGLEAHSSHRIRLVTHAGRFWRWRMQGAALTLAREIEAAVAHERPDVVVVSGMVHAAALLGLSRRSLHGVPTMLYLHENQLTYPVSEERPDDLTYAMANWLSMASVEVVAFNSEHHRDELLTALPGLLGSMPDHRHGHLLEEIAARCVVLPVGIDAARLAAATRPEPDGPPVLLWNHRWDHDKAPDEMVEAVDALIDEGVEFGVALTGGRPPTEPPLLTEVRERWAGRLVVDGDLDRVGYERTLLRSQVALSTARHDFFGVAVAEAAAAGAIPVVPHRCNYPHLLPEWAHEACLYRNAGERLARLIEALTLPGPSERSRLRSEMTCRCDWSVVAPRYDTVFSDLAEV